MGSSAPAGRRKRPQYTKSDRLRDPVRPHVSDPRDPVNLALSLLLSGVILLPPARHAPGPCTHDAGWAALVRAHLVRYPAMQPADAYKLLHQATLGSEHAVPSREMASRWLRREIAELPPGPFEPMVDTLGMGGRFARINLRPFLAAGGSPDSLLAAFVRTAEVAARDTAQLACALGVVREMIAAHEVTWAADSVNRLFSDAAAAGYPAMHHSDAFSAAYRPAYRVVSVTLVSAALP